MLNKKTFTIIVPVYQNESNLKDTVPKLLELKDKIKAYHIELLFVDDGSTDSSFQILTEQARAYPRNIRIIKLTRNFGQTAAIRAGLRHATGDCIGIISADLQEPHEAFIEMLREWEKGADFVIGGRERREEGKVHQIISSVYWKLVKKFALSDFPQVGYDFCLISRQVARDIHGINERNTSIFVLIYWLGYRPVVIPIIRKVRSRGESQWTLQKKIWFTVDTLIGFTYLPARLISFMGFVTAAFTLIYLGVMLILWFLLKASPPGWMSIFGLLSLVGSLVLLSLGIISEYLLRILDEVRRRPPYIVEKIVGTVCEKDQEETGHYTDANLSI